MEIQYQVWRETFGSLASHKKAILLTTGLCLTLGGAYSLLATPTYQSVAILRIQQEKGLGDSLLQSVTGTGSLGTVQRMNTNAGILQSHSVVDPVMQELAGHEKANTMPTYESFISQHISTKPYKDTELLEVDVKADTPEKAQEINQLLLQSFLGRLTDLSRAQQAQTKAFLEKRVKASKQELTTAEDKLQAYQVANRMYSADDQVQQFTEKMAAVDKAQAESQVNLEAAQAALETVDGQLDEAGKAVADSPAIQSYKAQLGQLEAERAGYLGTYTADHPKMRELDQEIQEVKTSLHQEISAIVNQEAPSNNAAQQALLTSKFTNEALVAAEEGKQAALHQIEAQSNQELAQLPGKEQGYIRLKRDANVAQDIYVMLAKKLEEAKVAEAMAPNDVQVVDQPTLPDHPIAPRKGLIMLLATLVGLVLSSIGAIAYDIFTKKITTGQEAESLVGLPVLGQVPRVRGSDLELEESQWSRILRRMKEALWKR